MFLHIFHEAVVLGPSNLPCESALLYLFIVMTWILYHENPGSFFFFFLRLSVTTQSLQHILDFYLLSSANGSIDALFFFATLFSLQQGHPDSNDPFQNIFLPNSFLISSFSCEIQGLIVFRPRRLLPEFHLQYSACITKQHIFFIQRIKLKGIIYFL